MPASSPIASLCVYCGSSLGTDPQFEAAARDLGRRIADTGLRLVYGGGAVGLMGVVADAVLAGGGDVIGVIPRGLFSREVGHRGLTHLYEVESMHERKQLMFELADAFVALPGGFGTLEELAEVTTWAQLGMHRKPIVLLDLDGFWQPMLSQFDRMVDSGLLKPTNRALIVSVGSVDDLLDAVDGYSAPHGEKWIGTSEI
jgi:uncharacterized protein (TIGR00730 family)